MIGIVIGYLCLGRIGQHQEIPWPRWHWEFSTRLPSLTPLQYKWRCASPLSRFNRTSLLAGMFETYSDGEIGYLGRACEGQRQLVCKESVTEV